MVSKYAFFTTIAVELGLGKAIFGQSQQNLRI